MNIFVCSYQLAVPTLTLHARHLSSSGALRVRVYFRLKEAEGEKGTDPHQGSHSY